MAEMVAPVTEHLYSLEEPWRSRFLALTAKRSMAVARDDGRLPTYRETMALLSDLALHRMVVQLLDAWQKS